MDRCQLCCCQLPEGGPVLRVWRAISREYLAALQHPVQAESRTCDPAPDRNAYVYKLWTVCEDCLNRPMAIYVQAASRLGDLRTLFDEKENPAIAGALEELRVWLRLRLPDEGEQFSCAGCRRQVVVYNPNDLTVTSHIYCSDVCARRRPPPEQSCDHCGKTYTPARRNRSRFCCNACKQANYRQRKGNAAN